MIETWKPVVGYEGVYEISELGRIRRLRAAQGTRVGRMVRAYPKWRRGGYLAVVLSRDGVSRRIALHKLVTASFIGPRPPGLEVNHKNFNTHDASLANLEYVTHGENMQHAARGGRMGAHRIRVSRLLRAGLRVLNPHFIPATIHHEVTTHRRLQHSRALALVQRRHSPQLTVNQ